MARHPALHNLKSPQTEFLKALFIWCPGPELNRHGTKYRGILSRKNNKLKSWEILGFLGKMKYGGYIIRHILAQIELFSEHGKNPLRVKFIILELL